LIEKAAPQTQHNGAPPRRVTSVTVFAILSRIAAVLFLFVVLSFGLLASQAQAHGSHGGFSVQTVANWDEPTGSERDAQAQRTTEADCGVNCCSAASCAAAVLIALHPVLGAVAADTRFAAQDNALAKPSAQSSLKRPPKA